MRLVVTQCAVSQRFEDVCEVCEEVGSLFREGGKREEGIK